MAEAEQVGNLGKGGEGSLHRVWSAGSGGHFKPLVKAAKVMMGPSGQGMRLGGQLGGNNTGHPAGSDRKSGLEKWWQQRAK